MKPRPMLPAPYIKASFFSDFTMVKLRKMEQSIHEMSSYPDAESREDYRLKLEEIGRYLTSIKPIVGRKVTASYRRKLGIG